MDALIRQAITEKHLIEFQYHGHHRVAEPHVYGRNNGVLQLLVYQVRGQSSSGRLPDWRRVDLHEISGLRLLNERFPGKRPNPSGEHSRWDEYFAVVT